MTPEQAKQKWCPMAFSPSSVSTTDSITRNSLMETRTKNRAVAANRASWGGPLPSECKCVADGCMMWHTRLSDPNDGYCGLAGFPT